MSYASYGAMKEQVTFLHFLFYTQRRGLITPDKFRYFIFSHEFSEIQLPHDCLCMIM